MKVQIYQQLIISGEDLEKSFRFTIPFPTINPIYIIWLSLLRLGAIPKRRKKRLLQGRGELRNAFNNNLTIKQISLIGKLTSAQFCDHKFTGPAQTFVHMYPGRTGEIGGCWKN